MEDHRKLIANMKMTIKEFKEMNKERIDQMIIIIDKIKIDKTEAGTEKLNKTTTRKEIEILQIIAKPINLRQLILNILDSQFHMHQATNQIFYHPIKQ